ncbi:transmembrane protein 68-like isoform X1 [Varroa jacobsoni]|uniref:transmembrane protein 68-like isoform X1 n=2 Tax=Varroa jacobsoni TaxID=62625 RepID=UPI000BFAA63B|nr:transmembrane protein 68-like isoform X1 [Varroa jacobsoni]
MFRFQGSLLFKLRLAYTMLWGLALLIPWLLWRLWPYWYLRPFLLHFILLPYVITAGATILTVAVHVSNQLGFDVESTYGVASCLGKFFIMPSLRILHGYDVVGVENIPLDRGALIVPYHALLPVDLYAFIGWFFLRTNKMISGSIDRLFWEVPLLRTLFKLSGCTSGGRDELVAELRNGSLKFILPGGAYEAMFSENYSLEWRNRTGFARVAKEADAPIIPMFTINTRQLYTMYFFGFREKLRQWYLEKRIPILIPSGGWPVKLRTYLGKPLTCGTDESAEEFARRVQAAVEELRDKYQRRPNSIIKAIADRFTLSPPN